MSKLVNGLVGLIGGLLMFWLVFVISGFVLGGAVLANNTQLMQSPVAFILGALNILFLGIALLSPVYFWVYLPIKGLLLSGTNNDKDQE